MHLTPSLYIYISPIIYNIVLKNNSSVIMRSGRGGDSTVVSGSTRPLTYAEQLQRQEAAMGEEGK